ncbi:DUF2955 domain-containing protein [Enterovibrio paralichthyis]|uniref:DUF2955 domain-containing protein n=1 Tax=Enterovibrio paralichthyis TaxID=2853805 RepID=UPI001C479CC8|nr:DUF2955 domain-containing protein [Enterovibrio paralichthyis]MBV7298419.1 DUF2955 domain-containing protein [Enterovibrio paralichthyis]
MFRKPGNGIIRVALFPLLLMFWQHIFGTDIPLIGPALCAVFLTTSSKPPPLKMVLLMTVVLFATAWLQAAISNLLLDQPLVYYSVLYVVFVWCMQRARENPQDLLATLLIVSTAMIAVFSRQKGIDVTQVPLGLAKNIAIAAFTAYLSYFLVPGGEPIAADAKPAPHEAVHTEIWHIAFKAAAVLLVLVYAIRWELVQSTIMIIVVALVIKDPDPANGHSYGIRRLLATYAGFLYALPVLGMNMLQTNLVGHIGMALVCALLMGIHAMQKRASFNTFQLLYSGFVVLVYYGLTNSAGSAFVEDGKRLGAILSAVLLGIVVLILLQPRNTAHNAM